MSMAAAHREGEAVSGSTGRALLFLVVLAYYWVSLSPFQDLSLLSNKDPWAGSSNSLNQMIAIGLFGVLAVFAVRHPLFNQIAQPRLLLGAIFGWFLVTGMLADDPSIAFRRVVMAGMVCIGASIFLLLPRDEKHFAKLLGIGLLLLLGLAYFGVIFMPSRALHLSTDVVEPQLAGLWRGFFGHKNTAAIGMSFTIFGGLFVWQRWSRFAGFTIVALGLLFLWNTGGKTSMAILPTVFVLAWAFERWRRLRYPLIVGSLGLFNLVAVGSAVYPGIRSFVSSLGIDASFTDRTDIWQIAFSAIVQSPITGHGFMSYWQTESMVYGAGIIESWAVLAANAHNAYLDTAISAGIPGLILVVAWIIFRPIADYNRAETTGNDPLLSRLFLRIWLYGIFAASLESSFFNNAGPVWFTILIAVFGLQYQGRAQIVAAREPAGEVAHA
jgi:O-antigen ligase